MGGGTKLFACLSCLVCLFCFACLLRLQLSFSIRAQLFFSIDREQLHQPCQPFRFIAELLRL